MATLNTSRTFYFTYLHKVNIWSYIWRSRTLHSSIFLFHRRNLKNVLSSCSDLFKSAHASYLILIILSAAELYFSSKEQKYILISPSHNKNGKNEYVNDILNVLLRYSPSWVFHFYCSFISIISKNSLSRTIWIVLCENKTTKIIWRHFYTK